MSKCDGPHSYDAYGYCRACNHFKHVHNYNKDDLCKWCGHKKPRSPVAARERALGRRNVRIWMTPEEELMVRLLLQR